MSASYQRIQASLNGIRDGFKCTVHGGVFAPSHICPACSAIICYSCLDNLDKMKQFAGDMMSCPQCVKENKIEDFPQIKMVSKVIVDTFALESEYSKEQKETEEKTRVMELEIERLRNERYRDWMARTHRAANDEVVVISSQEEPANDDECFVNSDSINLAQPMQEQETNAGVPTQIPSTSGLLKTLKRNTRRLNLSLMGLRHEKNDDEDESSSSGDEKAPTSLTNAEKENERKRKNVRGLPGRGGLRRSVRTRKCPPKQRK